MITQRYLRFLITLYYFEKNSILPLNKNFAEILNLSKSSISKTITYLSNNKLIYKTINNRIYLLPLGYDVLNEYIKKYNIMFDFFSTTLKLSPDQSHKDTLNIINKITDETIEKIKKQI